MPVNVSAERVYEFRCDSVDEKLQRPCSLRTLVQAANAIAASTILNTKRPGWSATELVVEDEAYEVHCPRHQEKPTEIAL